MVNPAALPVSTAVAVSGAPIALAPVTGPEAFDRSVARLAALSRDDEYDEDELDMRPSEEVIQLALGYLETAYRALETEYPKPAIFPTEDGGIRMQWTSPERHLSLVLSPGIPIQSYLYRGDGAISGSDREVSQNLLVQRLNWFLIHE